MDEERNSEVVIYDREDPSPFETMILVVCVLGGLALLVFDGRVSGALAQEVPGLVTVTLAVGLVLGGATGLAGQFLRTVDSGVLEAAGLVLLSCLLAAYAGFALAYAGTHALISVMFFTAIIAASAWRIVRIQHRIRRIRSAVATGTDDLRSREEG